MFDKLAHTIKSFIGDKNKHSAHQEGVNVSIEELISMRQFSSGVLFRSNSKVYSAHIGTYRSPFKGRGMEFEEVRPYAVGDDIRNIDWRVTARSGEPYTKLFSEEKERPILFVVDMRHSMRFGTRKAFKSVVASKITAILGWAGLEHGDKIGGIILSSGGLQKFSPQRQRKRLLGIFNSLSIASKENNRNNRSSMAEALAEIRRISRTGGMVFVISDFYDFDREAERQLSHISSHSETVMVYVHDVLEDKAPPPGVYRISDENQSITINSEDKSWCDDYNKFFAEKLDKLRLFAQHHRAKFISIKTDDIISDKIRSELYKRN